MVKDEFKREKESYNLKLEKISFSSKLALTFLHYSNKNKKFKHLSSPYWRLRVKAKLILKSVAQCQATLLKMPFQSLLLE